MVYAVLGAAPSVSQAELQDRESAIKSSLARAAPALRCVLILRDYQRPTAAEMLIIRPPWLDKDD